MKVIVDAMGGDNAPGELVKGAIDANAETGVEIVLAGKEEEILRVFESMGLKAPPPGIEIHNASEVVDMDDDPATAVRVKKDSSLAVALNLLRDGGGDAMVSAGSTGALLAGATLVVKRVRGIRRAALAPVIPNASGGFILIDCGANVECTAEYLLQFAFMGSFYAEDTLKTTAPRIGLLNNGEERTKGTPLHIEAYDLLEKAEKAGHLNFVGNIEAKGAMKGACDVLVSDGFTGNILLKALEGMAGFALSELKGVFSKSKLTELSGLLVRKHLRELKKSMDPDTVGGTVLLGISKPVVKAHGSSNAAAVRSAIRQATEAAAADVASRLAANIDRMVVGS